MITINQKFRLFCTTELQEYANGKKYHTIPSNQQGRVVGNVPNEPEFRLVQFGFRAPILVVHIDEMELEHDPT